MTNKKQWKQGSQHNIEPLRKQLATKHMFSACKESRVR